MKFSLSWLRTHLQTEAALDQIIDTLTMIGLEVDTVQDRGAALREFRVAQVIAATPHPNADRLRVCEVDTGAGIVSVVCGAPNARAGMKAVFAPPGSVIPATGATLKLGEIRGVQSAGMLLSAREMGLGEDHDGIIELPDSAAVGAAYPAWAGLDDPVIEIAVTPNRGDALGVRGVARDLAGAGLGTLLPWLPAKIEGRGASAVAWRLDWPEACPFILGRTVSGVRNGPSPAWLADRLRSIGLRPISALVDITNFFAIDLGRPLHVFDVGKLHGDLTIRRGAGETLHALDGRDYTVTAEDCVLADDAGVQSLGGVMGGAATGCTDETTDVFIECALFDPIRVALTGRHHKINSDARQRFERGVDPALPPQALEAATALVLQLCGGEPSEIVAAGAEPPWRRNATLQFATLARVSGDVIPDDEAVAALARLGFDAIEHDAHSVTVQVPSWRNDIAAARRLDPAPNLAPARLEAAQAGCAAMEPQLDLIEEVLRLRGLDTIPVQSLPVAATVPGTSLSPRQSRTAQARRLLAARGLLECITFSFHHSVRAALFAPAAGLGVANPIAADLDQMRATPLATLIEAASRNAARGFADTQLFEIGPGFSAPTETGQHRIAAGLRTGATPRHWRESARPVDAFDAKADALALLATLGVPLDSLSATPDAPGYYHPGRSGTLRQGPKLILAYFGAVHPRVLASFDRPSQAAGFEVFLDAIAEPKRRRRAPPDLPTLQPVRRDFAFVAAADIAAEQILRAARAADRSLITAVSLFDVYPLPDGRVSLAIEVTLQPRDHTLSDEQLEAMARKIVAAVGKATGAGLR